MRLSWGRTTLAVALIATMFATAVGATAEPKDDAPGRSSATSADAAGPKPGKGPNKQVGARSLDDPLFPQVGNGGYDARHYRIALDYDPATNFFNEAAAR